MACVESEAGRTVLCVYLSVCVSRGAKALACLRVFLRDNRTEACSFCHVTFSEILEVLGSIKTRLQLTHFTNVVLYVYFMNESSFN